MKKFDGWVIPLAMLFFIVCASGFALYPPHTSSDIATWVGAVGTVGAVMVAVWVSHRQYQQTRDLEIARSLHEAAKDVLETKAFVGAVVEELNTIWQGYAAETRTDLWAVPDGQIFDFVFPATPDAFTIFNNASARVGKVTDQELRRLIVSVYAQAKGLISSYQLNNAMVVDYRDSVALSMAKSTALHYQRTSYLQSSLVDYARKLKKRDEALENDLGLLLARAKAYLDHNP